MVDVLVSGASAARRAGSSHVRAQNQRFNELIINSCLTDFDFYVHITCKRSAGSSHLHSITLKYLERGKSIFKYYV